MVDKRDDAHQSPLDERLFNSSLEKAIRVLEAFASSGQGKTVQELTAATGADRSSVQRAVYTLHRLGYLSKNAETKRYVIALKAMDLSFSYLRADRIVETAMPHLANLVEDVGESIHLSRLDGADIIYLIRWPRGPQKYFASLPGRRLPAFCTSGGRAMIAQWDPEDARRFLETTDRPKVTPKTVTDIDEIMAELEVVRQNGYAIIHEGCLLGETAVSAPIFFNDGRQLAAIHITLAKHKWTNDKIVDQLVPPLLSATQAVSEILR